MRDFEIIDHTADIGIAAYGDDIRAVFINAALGMLNIITEVDKISETIRKNISVKAENQTELLAAWLNELLYYFDADNLIFSRFEITDMNATDMKAIAYGEQIDLNRHEIKSQIKAATYHMLKLEKTDRFRAQVILDV